MRRTLPLVLACIAAVAAGTAAHAQDPRFDLRQPRTDSTQVTVTFTFPVPLETDDAEQQQKAMQQARRRLYEIADGECRLLLATIANQCRLSRVNVHSNLNRRGADASRQASMSATATYRIELKPEI